MSVLARITEPDVGRYLLRDEDEVVVDEVRRHWVVYVLPVAELLLAVVLMYVGTFVIEPADPGGWLVLAFQAGDGERRQIAGYGHDVDLEAWQHSPSYVESLLAEAGAPVQVRVIREPHGVEKTRQAYLLATVATT